MCPFCGRDRWRLTEAAYVRALLEKDAEDLVEATGVVKIPCDNCGYLALFDAETIGEYSSAGTLRRASGEPSAFMLGWISSI
jgi:hypothetical protein